MSKLAILCVDDEALILLAIKEELKNAFGGRFLYETALTADEGVEIIEDLVADGIRLILVITDWLMPGMKGDEFLRHIKVSYPEVKTIMITGHASQEAIQNIQSEHLTDALLIKPWKDKDLIASIRECLKEAGVEY